MFCHGYRTGSESTSILRQLKRGLAAGAIGAAPAPHRAWITRVRRSPPTPAG
ncbi:hypothetical protein GL4_1959 [Methyloceanibacter caenitepidi]|uniref:Uncharacterized protein n=1 Tax=Methyloceanibacter caenitepidi TaxID=1384459 RepID=A0A0A8K601_9HYPH|nr:hypothetical protein GL4_1959 [Methyloceanibacter caenitepidi]